MYDLCERYYQRVHEFMKLMKSLMLLELNVQLWMPYVCSFISAFEINNAWKMGSLYNINLDISWNISYD